MIYAFFKVLVKNGVHEYYSCAFPKDVCELQMFGPKCNMHPICSYIFDWQVFCDIAQSNLLKLFLL